MQIVYLLNYLYLWEREREREREREEKKRSSNGNDWRSGGDSSNVLYLYFRQSLGSVRYKPTTQQSFWIILHIYLPYFPNTPIMDADAKERSERKKIQRQFDSLSTIFICYFKSGFENSRDGHTPTKLRLKYIYFYAPSIVILLFLLFSVNSIWLLI